MIRSTDHRALYDITMKRCFLACILILTHNSHAEENDTMEFRMKRQLYTLPLVYPYGGTYKLVMGFSAPISNSDKIPMSFVASFQYQFVQFANISELSRYYIIKEVGREEREADLAVRRDERLVFYQSAIDMLDSKGFNGEECVYRALCESAQHPVEEDGLFGEVMHILLTPDYGRSDFDEDPEWKEIMGPYIDASIAGRQMYNCEFLYNKCPAGDGILELISVLNYG